MTFSNLIQLAMDHGIRRAKFYEAEAGVIVGRLPKSKNYELEAAVDRIRPASIMIIWIYDLGWWESRCGRWRGISLRTLGSMT